MNIETLKQILHYNHKTGEWRWLVKNGSNNDVGSMAGTIGSFGYRIITYKGKKYKSSRLAFIYMGLDVPIIVDHVNMIKHDDRWDNLRAATINQNGANRTSRHKDRPKGITWNNKRKKWIAQITVDNRLKYLGGFNCPAAASFVYQIEAHKAFGSFARGF